MKKQTMFLISGVLALFLVASAAFAQRPGAAPANRAGSRISSREPGTLSRAHVSFQTPRTNHPAPVSQNSRGSMNAPRMTPEARKPAPSVINPANRIERSFPSSHRDVRTQPQINRNQTQSRDRSFDRDHSRDHDRRPSQPVVNHRDRHDTRTHRPVYRPTVYRRPQPKYSLSIGTNGLWYDPFYSNYYSGLFWDVSYNSQKFGISLSSGYPTYSYVRTRQVWVPGYWETVYEPVRCTGDYGVVYWRNVSRSVWRPGYWKAGYR